MDFELRKWKKDDVFDVAYFANNRKISCKLKDAFPYPYTLSDAEKYITKCLSSDENKMYCRAIVVNGRVAGSIGIYFGTDILSRTCEIGFWLAENYWNHGIMSEALKQITNDIFSNFDVVRISARPFSNNIGSRKALEKAGFELEGIMKKGAFKDGKYIDYCMYALLRDDEPEIV